MLLLGEEGRRMRKPAREKLMWTAGEAEPDEKAKTKEKRCRRRRCERRAVTGRSKWRPGASSQSPLRPQRPHPESECLT